MRIAAFDLSLTASGYARDGVIGVESGVIEPKKLFGIERLLYVREKVYELARNADLVVIEGYAYGAKGSAVYNIGELGGVIRCAFHECRLPWVEVPPANLKMFATGTGNAKKDAVLAAAIRKLEYSRSNHNEADALWLLEMARTYRAGDATQTQARALAKIKWPELVLDNTHSPLTEVSA